MVRHYMRHMQ